MRTRTGNGSRQAAVGGEFVVKEGFEGSTLFMQRFCCRHCSLVSSVGLGRCESDSAWAAQSNGEGKGQCMREKVYRATPSG